MLAGLMLARPSIDDEISVTLSRRAEAGTNRPGSEADATPGDRFLGCWPEFVS